MPADYAFHHTLRVRFAETDAMAIVHHGRYLPYLEEARVEYLRHLGHPYTTWRAEGIDATVLEIFVRYRRALHFDDAVDVHVLMAATTRTVFQMAYLLTVDGVAAATAVTVHGAVTADGRPTRLPGWLVEMGPS
ncbi:MAG: thioesterase family protein [Ilumatobacteraceae bacterium]